MSDRTPILTKAFLEHQAELINFLHLRLRCRATARDICQDVYIRLLGVEHPDKIKNSRGYIFKIAQNLMIDHIRIEQRRSELLQQKGDVLFEGSNIPTPEDIVLMQSKFKSLHEALEELPETTKQIFKLQRFEGKTRQQIADEFNISVTTVENHIKLVLEHIAEKLEK